MWTSDPIPCPPMRLSEVFGFGRRWLKWWFTHAPQSHLEYYPSQELDTLQSATVEAMCDHYLIVYVGESLTNPDEPPISVLFDEYAYAGICAKNREAWDIFLYIVEQETTQ